MSVYGILGCKRCTITAAASMQSDGRDWIGLEIVSKPHFLLGYVGVIVWRHPRACTGPFYRRIPVYPCLLSTHLSIYPSICQFIYQSIDPHTADYSLRLVPLNASSPVGAGRLDLWFGGEWRPVCAGEWEREEATVACQQLGYEQLVQFRSELLNSN